MRCMKEVRGYDDSYLTATFSTQMLNEYYLMIATGTEYNRKLPFMLFRVASADQVYTNYELSHYMCA